MNINLLRSFISVAQHLNFSAAARELYIDQSSLSKQISELENSIGVKLFIRNTRKVQLTAAGERLLDDAKGIISLSEKAVNRAKQASEGVIGKLSIGFLEAYGTEVPILIREFRNCRADVNLQLHSFKRKALNEALENGSMDIGLSLSDCIEDIPGIIWKKSIERGALCAIVPQNHPLARRDKISITELRAERFVVLSPEEHPLSYQQVRRLCSSNGFYPDISAQATSLENLLLLIETEMGVGVAYDLGMKRWGYMVSFVGIEECPEDVHWAIAWRKDNSNPLISTFIDIAMNSGGFY